MSLSTFHCVDFSDAIIIPIVNCGTSIFAGTAVFSIVGNMAKEAGRDVSDVILEGMITLINKWTSVFVCRSWFGIQCLSRSIGKVSSGTPVGCNVLYNDYYRGIGFTGYMLCH